MLRDPSAYASGRQKGARGDKKVGSGRQQGDVHKTFLAQPPSLLEKFGKRKDRLGYIVSALKKLDKDLRNLEGKSNFSKETERVR